MTNIKSSYIEKLVTLDEANEVARLIKEEPQKTPLVFTEFHITEKCNATCRFCNQNRVTNLNKCYISASEFDFVLDDLCRNGLQGIRFSGGGEPTVHPELDSMLLSVQDHSIRIVDFVLNGILLTDKLSRKLLECNIERLSISLIAPNAELWSIETGLNQDKYYDIIRNIQHFNTLNSKRHTNVVISFVLDEITYSSIKYMEILADELEVDFFIHDLNNYVYDLDFQNLCSPIIIASLDSLRKDTVKNKMFISRLKSIEKVRRKMCNIENYSHRVRNAFCLAPWLGLLVKTNGDVHICCAHVDQSYSLGNIRVQSITDIINGEKFTDMRKEARNIFLSDDYIQGYSDFDNYCYLSEKCLGKCGPRNGIFAHSVIEKLVKVA